MWTYRGESGVAAGFPRQNLGGTVDVVENDVRGFGVYEKIELRTARLVTDACEDENSGSQVNTHRPGSVKLVLV